MALLWLYSLDLYVFSVINQFAGQNHYLDKTAIFFAEYLIAFLLLFILIEFKNIRFVYNTIAAVVLSFGFNFIVQLFYSRPRPFLTYHVTLLLNPLTSASFPSGHATAAFAIAMCIFLYNRKTGILAFIIAFLVGIARVFGGVHYLTDAIAGALIGIFFGFITYKIFSKDYKFLSWLKQE